MAARISQRVETALAVLDSWKEGGDGILDVRYRFGIRLSRLGFFKEGRTSALIP